jgi:hypothetical protein
VSAGVFLAIVTSLELCVIELTAGATINAQVFS